MNVCLILVSLFICNMVQAGSAPKKVAVVPRAKKIMPISLEKVTAKKSTRKSSIKTAKVINKKGNKNLVEVSFGGAISESDLEPLAKSAIQAEREARRKKSQSEMENKISARNNNDKKQGIALKSDAGEVISVPESPDERNVASAAKASRPVPASKLYQIFQRQTELEVDEDYAN